MLVTYTYILLYTTLYHVLNRNYNQYKYLKPKICLHHRHWRNPRKEKYLLQDQSPDSCTFDESLYIIWKKWILFALFIFHRKISQWKKKCFIESTTMESFLLVCKHHSCEYVAKGVVVDRSSVYWRCKFQVAQCAHPRNHAHRQMSWSAVALQLGT